MNLNNFAKDIAHEEGQKVSLNIGQIKEVMRLTFIKLRTYDDQEVIKTLNRYKNKEYL